MIPLKIWIIIIGLGHPNAVIVPMFFETQAECQERIDGAPSQNTQRDASCVEYDMADRR